MAVQTYQTKVGDTFVAQCTYQGSDGTGASLDAEGIVPSSQFLSPDGSRHIDIAYTKGDQSANPGAYTLRIATADFEPGTWTWDIRYTRISTGDSFSTETVRVVFNPPVTL